MATPFRRAPAGAAIAPGTSPLRRALLLKFLEGPFNEAHAVSKLPRFIAHADDGSAEAEEEAKTTSSAAAAIE